MRNLIRCLALTVLLLGGCGGDSGENSGPVTKVCYNCGGLSGNALISCKVANSEAGCD